MSKSGKGREYIIKTILVGVGGSGKTSLVNRYCDNKFQDDYKLTVGTNFNIKRLKVKDTSVAFQIWDLGGQSRFQHVRKPFYKGSDTCLAVFDLTRFDSLEGLSEWLDEMYGQIEPVIPTVLAGNKSDLENDRQIGADYVKEYIEVLSKEDYTGYEEIGLPYIETSAKTGKNVDKAFRKLAEMYIEFRQLN